MPVSTIERPTAVGLVPEGAKLVHQRWLRGAIYGLMNQFGTLQQKVSQMLDAGEVMAYQGDLRVDELMNQFGMLQQKVSQMLVELWRRNLGCLGTRLICLWHASTERPRDPLDLPRDPLDTVERDVKRGHPRGMAIHLPEQVKAVIKQNIDSPPAELAIHRREELTKWTIRAQRLRKREVELRAAPPPHGQSLMGTKGLLLFKEMLKLEATRTNN